MVILRTWSVSGDVEGYFWDAAWWHTRCILQLPRLPGRVGELGIGTRYDDLVDVSVWSTT